MENLIHDVIIIGGGVVGTAIARELSRYKISICLIEKETEVAFGVTKANSGIVHAGFDSPPNTLKGRLCAKGNHLYNVLNKEIGIPHKQIGELVLGFNDDDRPKLEALKKNGEANGVPHMRIIERSEVLKIEPNIAKDVKWALLAPSAGVTNPYEFTYILAANAFANGVAIRTNEEVISIVTDNSDNKLTVITTKGRHFCRFIINAAGLYADRIAAMAGAGTFKIHPRKGEEYLLDRKCEGIVSRIIFPLPDNKSKGTLIIPTLDGTIMVGPSAEDVKSKNQLPTTNETFSDIFDKAKRMVPSLNTRSLISAFAGLRPVADGNDFIIGTSPIKGFINAAGIQSPGLTAAPAIAVMIADILCDEGLVLKSKENFINVPGQNFKVRGADFDELDRKIRENKDYGQIVCRCETISEAEIRQAIRQGARTLDGIKFRTRAGMGRCQGGFCTFRIMEILASELGVSPLTITKKGSGSELLVGDIVK